MKGPPGFTSEICQMFKREKIHKPFQKTKKGKIFFNL